MIQEEKELLLRDLCARVPYGVKIDNMGKPSILTSINNKYRIIVETAKVDRNLSFNLRGLNVLEIEDAKPYLFPFSSMTEEQKKYITNRWGINEDFDFEIDPNWGKFCVELGDTVDFINWCYENHFDINNLIPKELAFDATGLNIY